jgi:hypothetical protein
MAAPAEPLLPTEEPRPSRLKLWIAIGVALLGIGGSITIALLLPAPGAPRDAETPSADRPAAAEPGPKSTVPKGTPKAVKPAEAQEKAAQELYGAAEAFERDNPGDTDKVVPRYLDVFHKHPSTTWGRKAEQKAGQLNKAAQAAFEREFQGVRKDAQTLAAAGHFKDAIETVQNYVKEQTKDATRQRAEREIALLENAAREAFNRLAPQAAGLARKGEYAEAATLYEKLKEDTIPEVASRCDAAIAQLRDAGKAYETFQTSKRAEEAGKAFREGSMPRVLSHLRARRYDEALKEFDAAAADPAAAGLEADLSRERSALVQAAAFWEGFLKTLRAKSAQDVTIALAGPKEHRLSGKLVKVGTDRATVDTGDAIGEATFDKIHLDQVVAWTVGKSLPAEEAATYVKASLFFFCDGHDDLARLYLATAKEMGADITEPERIFREGLLRGTPKK